MLCVCVQAPEKPPTYTVYDLVAKLFETDATTCVYVHFCKFDAIC